MALLLTGLMLGILEILWRSQGFRPSVVDDKDVWCVWRDRTSSAGRKAVAVVGFSRIQLAFDTATWKKQFPDQRPAMLAINGKHPMAVLQDLAEDTSFKGHVICDLTEAGLFPSRWGDQQDYVDYRKAEWTLLKKCEALLRLEVQSHVALANPSVDLWTILHSVRAGKWPKPPYIQTRADRSRVADYAKCDLHAQRAFRLRQAGESSLPLQEGGQDAFLEGLKRLRSLTDIIQRRGGKVIIVRLPVSGDVAELEADVYPRKEYWDEIASSVNAIVIHFSDVSAMAILECPEGSHLDMRDAPLFTAALAEELKRRSVF